MIKYKLSKVLLTAFALFFIDVNAEDICDNNYNVCVQKCDSMENPSGACYTECDEYYSKCLETQQSLPQQDYTEEIEQTQSPDADENSESYEK